MNDLKLLRINIEKNTKMIDAPNVVKPLCIEMQKMIRYLKKNDLEKIDYWYDRDDDIIRDVGGFRIVINVSSLENFKFNTDMFGKEIMRKNVMSIFEIRELHKCFKQDFMEPFGKHCVKQFIKERFDKLLND